jgi:hypothetical protein
LLVLPTDTLPKVRAAGLALRAMDGTELAVADVEVVAAEVEVPLALVTPAQPERITPPIKSVKVKKRISEGRQEYPCETVERDRERELPEGVGITRRVYEAHQVYLYWSDGSIRYRCSVVFERAFGTGLKGKDSAISRNLRRGLLIIILDAVA